ncbi:MAG: zf-HC2 domain-containing protein [Oscillospiraceae bacterium]|nr:zf-HC2 domain-containing protein [Oscillospiraceae bacterium]
MKISCQIIEDLLPLYADKVCSEESGEMVEKHIAECGECRSKLEAMTEEIPKSSEDVPEMKSENAFKKYHRRYVRLVVITLLLCAAVMIPAVFCGVLTINEDSNRGMSWSTLNMNSELRKLGSKFRQGKYLEALDMMYLPNQDTYSEQELAGFKELFAEDLEEYFSEHPIVRVDVFSQQTFDDNVYGRLILELEERGDNTHNVYAQVLEFEYDNGLELLEHYLSFGTDFKLYEATEMTEADEGSAEEYESFSRGFPAIILNEADAAVNYFRNLDISGSMLPHMFVSIEDYAECFENETLSELYDRYDTLTREFAEDYFFIDGRTTERQYVRDEELCGFDRSYLYRASISFLCGGELITVNFDIPFREYYFSCPNRLSALRNISYSPNTPDEFKERFEEIFA